VTAVGSVSVKANASKGNLPFLCSFPGFPQPLADERNAHLSFRFPPADFARLSCLDGEEGKSGETATYV
jgi:hypothetical protein